MTPIGSPLNRIRGMNLRNAIHLSAPHPAPVRIETGTGHQLQTHHGNRGAIVLVTRCQREEIVAMTPLDVTIETAQMTVGEMKTSGCNRLGARHANDAVLGDS